MKVERLLFSTFGIVGIGMLVGCGLLVISTREFLAVAKSADGTVVRLEYERSSSSSGGAYYPIVRFLLRTGETFEFRSSVGSSPPSYRRGESVRVLYDPTAPESAEIDSFFSLWFAPILLGFLGSVFGAFGVGYWGWFIARVRREAWLARHGRRIVADIVDVAIERSVKRNRRSPWRITAQWTDPLGRKVHVFKSARIRFDPTPFMKGETVSVLIDPDDPRRYMVDLSFLPEPAN